jgi:hypothetical protein
VPHEPHSGSISSSEWTIKSRGLAGPTPTRAVEAYVGMWNATDARERRALAEEALPEDAVLLHPTFEAQSRSEAVALAWRFHDDTPGPGSKWSAASSTIMVGFAWPGRWYLPTGRQRATVNPLASSLRMDGCAA